MCLKQAFYYSLIEKQRLTYWPPFGILFYAF